MYEIKKGIPIISKRRFPWANMEVGDCFDIPLTERKNPVSSVFSSFTVYKKTHPDMKITSRTIKEENLIRTWRIK